VSNNAALTGWNSTMSIIDILAQLQNSYGKPNMMMLFNNDTLFRSPMKPGDSPEMLFYCLEQCQEVQRIGKVPYSDEQIIANAIRILATSNIFPLKEFDAWEATAAKTYPALKTIFHEAYGCRLTAVELCTTTGQTGYTNNTIYNAFEATNEDTDDDTVDTIITVPPTAAAATTAVSTLNTVPSTMNADIAAAISQLSANQTAIMTQKAAMSFAPASKKQATCRPSNTFQVPPIQQVAIPFLQQTFLPPASVHLWTPGWTRAWPGTRGTRPHAVCGSHAHVWGRTGRTSPLSLRWWDDAIHTRWHANAYITGPKS
jgi:hypothetical protein